MRRNIRWISLFFALLLTFSLCGCGTVAQIAKDTLDQTLQSDTVSGLLDSIGIQELLKESGIQTLLEKGVSILDMLKDGISLDSLIEGGLTSEILEQAGISLSDLEQYGIDADTLAKYGLTLFDSEESNMEAEPDAESADSDSGEEIAEPEEAEASAAPVLAEDGVYTAKDEVALYIHIYGHLPSNFITKEEAKALGWEGGSLESYASGKSIGGDHFGNYEGLLPDKDGRSYTECDIDTMGASSRGAKRIVFSNDGLIYYTDDHYESFTLLYGEDK